ncbi:polysaccharide lyase family 7 protein [Sphingomonas silueang]|uniref:polysaccharide lyase family 7 protein n=1 Tax=Sphingomonas silueang TaxID=3156617 RepID=UPI0032B4AC2D
MLLGTSSCGDGRTEPGTVTVPPNPSPGPSPAPTDTPTPTAAVPTCQPVTADPTSLSPYSDPAFRRVLDNALTLQWPVSVNACMNTAALQAFAIDPDNFYRDDAGRLVFSFANGVNDSNASVTTRMELRGANFDAAAADKVLDASFRLPVIPNRSGSFTIAQVFGDTDGAPILRVFFSSSREGQANHLWAAYRRGLGDDNTSFTDLGAAPTPDETGRIRIRYNIGGAIELLSSGLDSTVRLDENFAFWTQAGKRTYFKAGCYLQSAGACEVRFTALTFDR